MYLQLQCMRWQAVHGALVSMHVQLQICTNEKMHPLPTPRDSAEIAEPSLNILEENVWCYQEESRQESLVNTSSMSGVQ